MKPQNIPFKLVQPVTPIIVKDGKNVLAKEEIDAEQQTRSIHESLTAQLLDRTRLLKQQNLAIQSIIHQDTAVSPLQTKCFLETFHFLRLFFIAGVGCSSIGLEYQLVKVQGCRGNDGRIVEAKLANDTDHVGMLYWCLCGIPGGLLDHQAAVKVK